MHAASIDYVRSSVEERLVIDAGAFTLQARLSRVLRWTPIAWLDRVEPATGAAKDGGGYFPEEQLV
jgi:hypothetical protein